MIDNNFQHQRWRGAFNTEDDIKGKTAIIRDAKTVSGERIVELAPTVVTVLEKQKATVEAWKISNKDLWKENNLIW